MGATVVIQVFNRERFDKIINNLSEAEEEVVKPTVQNGLKNMVDIAQGLCPVDKGKLQKSIHIEGEYPYVMFVADAVNEQGQGYAQYPEYGTWKQEPQPYMHPAVDAVMVDLIPTIRMNLRNFIRS